MSESSGTLNLTVGILSGSIAVPVVVTYSTIAGEASGMCWSIKANFDTAGPSNNGT